MAREHIYHLHACAYGGLYSHAQASLHYTVFLQSPWCCKFLLDAVAVAQLPKCPPGKFSTVVRLQHALHATMMPTGANQESREEAG